MHGLRKIVFFARGTDLQPINKSRRKFPRVIGAMKEVPQSNSVMVPSPELGDAVLDGVVRRPV